MKKGAKSASIRGIVIGSGFAVYAAAESDVALSARIGIMLKNINNNEAKREIAKERFQTAVHAIERLCDGSKSPILIAIDGRTGAGKTTLAKYLRDCFSLNLFHMDDFYLQGHQRTRERLSEVGGNVDYERFREEVLLPVLRGETVYYQPFNYLTMDFDLSYGRKIAPKRLNLIEGSYSMHPYFGEVYDLGIFMDVTYEAQIQNVIDRQGTAELDDYIDKWIPKTDRYLERFGIRNRCDIIIDFPGS